MHAQQPIEEQTDEKAKSDKEIRRKALLRLVQLKREATQEPPSCLVCGGAFELFVEEANQCTGCECKHQEARWQVQGRCTKCKITMCESCGQEEE